MGYLNREAAPFGPELWEAIEQQAVAAARDILTARRFLDVEGPYGLGLVSVELGKDTLCEQASAEDAQAVMSAALSVPMFRKEFSLSIRRVEASRVLGQPLDLSPVMSAAEALARREEAFIYYGQEKYGLAGLMSAKGSHVAQIGDWKKVDQALEDVLRAVNFLDSAGFRGPYALALSPALYNGLFRRYEGSDMLQLEHLQRLCQLGVYKAPVEGGVVVDPRVGRLIIGQDLKAGFATQDGIHYQLYLSESIVLMLEAPGALCTLKTKATA